MIGAIPEFMSSEHLKRKRWIDGGELEYLDNTAPMEERAEYEEYYNDIYSKMQYKDWFPDMKDPYRCWNGEFVDKGEGK